MKGICCGHSFEVHGQVDAIQMSTHNICFLKEVKKNYTGCNLRTSEFLDCALLGVCAVIRSNTVYNFDPLKYDNFIVKLGFTGVYIIFLNSVLKHRLWVLIRTASVKWF